jgi:hypothetical protein
VPDDVLWKRGNEDPAEERRRQLVAGPVLVTSVAKDDHAAIEAFEAETLRLVRKGVAYLNKPEVRSTFKVLSVRVEGSYPDTLLVVSVREYECGYGEDEYAIWKGYPWHSPEEAAELIAAWVGENN